LVEEWAKVTINSARRKDHWGEDKEAMQGEDTNVPFLLAG